MEPAKALIVISVWGGLIVSADAADVTLTAPTGDSTIYTPIPWAEVFTGFAAGPHSYYADAGAVLALNRNLDADGFLVRMRGSGGSYSSDRTPAIHQSVFFEAGEVMLGYHASVAGVNLTGYIGPEVQHHANKDPTATVAGTRWGIKGQVQLYTPFADNWYFFGLGSISSAWSSYFALAKVGYRVTHALAIGPEVAALGNVSFDAIRAGAFVNLGTALGEITLSGGYQWNEHSDTTKGDGLYGSLGVRKTF